MTVFIMAFMYTIWRCFMQPDKFYEDRILWLSGWIAASLIIICHSITIDKDGGVVARHISSFFSGVAFIGFGAIIYIVLFPENVFPGYVDVFGQSHTFWHIAVFISTAMNLNFDLKVANERIESDCLQKLIF